MAHNTSAALSNHASLFRHTQLPLQRSFRLISFATTATENNISVEISVHNLDRPPSFRALSYVCGLPYQDFDAPASDNSCSASERILCGDAQIFVIPNLKDALVALQRISFTGYIWIDALCIDQENANEKSHQVALMGELYGVASEVIVWLGPQSTDFDIIVWATTELLRGVATAIDRSPSQFRSIEYYGDPRLYEVLNIGSTPVVRRKIERFVKFLHCARYFQRSWIVQEVTLPKTIVGVCGIGFFHFPALIEVTYWLTAAGYLPQICNNLWHPRQLPSPNYVLQIARIRSLCPPKTSSPPSGQSSSRNLPQEISAFTTSSDPRAVPAAWLAKTLISIRNFRCTDPRDKVYSIISLVNPGFEATSLRSIFPDYHLTIQQVYINTMSLILRQTHLLDVLGTIEPRTSKATSLRLPSWVPDLSVPLEQPMPMCLLGPPADASRCSEAAQCYFEIQGSVLKCDGLQQARVKYCMKEDLQALTFQHKLHTALQFVGQLPRLIDNTPCFEILWRTLTMNMDLDGSRSITRKLGREFALAIACDCAQDIQFNHIDKGISISLEHELNRFQELFDDFNPDLAFERLEVQEVRRYLDLFAKCKAVRGTPLLTPLLGQVGMLDARFAVLIRVLTRTLPARQLLITDKDQLVLAPLSAEVGDEIWLLRNARLLHVLHGGTGPEADLETENETSHRRRQYVGECFIYGCMHGELLPKASEADRAFQKVSIV